MALSLKLLFTATSDCLSFDVYDNTSPYASNNTGGWGSPNPAIASASAATLTISRLTDYATSTYTTPVEIDAYDTLPNITNTPFTVTGEMIEGESDASLIDGYYKVVYDIAGNSGGAYTATVTKYIVLTCQIDACYKSLADQVALCSCDCIELEEKLNKIAYFRRQLTAATNCGNIGAIVKYIEYLTNLCEDEGSCC